MRTSCGNPHSLKPRPPERESDRQIYIYREREREGDRERDREKRREKARQKERQREKERKRENQRERESLGRIPGMDQGSAGFSAGRV